jgi:ribosomal-protein-alanine N-acetyltransferase
MSELNLVIAPATEADLPAMMALENACFSDPWTEGAMRSTFAIPVTRILVARLAGEVVGFAIAYLIPPEGEIADICVSPAMRGKGIGGLLLNGLIEDSHCNQFWLEVRMSNLAAQRLYVKTGFQILGVRKNYYDHPKEDAIVMGLTL